MTFYPDLLFLLQYVRFVGDPPSPPFIDPIAGTVTTAYGQNTSILWNKFDQKNGIRVGTAVLFFRVGMGFFGGGLERMRGCGSFAVFCVVPGDACPCGMRRACGTFERVGSAGGTLGSFLLPWETLPGSPAISAVVK